MNSNIILDYEFIYNNTKTQDKLESFKKMRLTYLGGQENFEDLL